MTEHDAISSKSENNIIDRMTYNDYLSAVYSYDEAVEAASLAQNEVDRASVLRSAAETELMSLRAADSDCLRSIDKIISADVRSRREVWEKSRKRFDLKLSTRRTLAEQNAETDIKNKREEHESALITAKKTMNSIEKHIAELDRSYTALLEEQKKFSDFTGRTFPPCDSEALEMLCDAEQRRLLSPMQREMLDDTVDKVCKPWISCFDDLIGTEKSLTKTEFYKEYKKAAVTPSIIKRVSDITAAVAAALFSAIIIALNLSHAEKAAIFANTIVTMIGCAGVFASAMHTYTDGSIRPSAKSPEARRRFAAAAFAFGMTAGFLIARFVTALSASPAALLFHTAAACACALTFGRAVKTRFVSELISRLPFLKDAARRDILRKYENADGGRISFMIFCYLRHESVLQYLSMVYAQRETDSMQRKINFNRKDIKYFRSQLDDADKRLDQLKAASSDVEEYEKKRRAELADEIEAIESERPKLPDFEALARQACKDRTAAFDKRHAQLAEEISQREAELSEIETDCAEKLNRAMAKKMTKKRIAAALRSWNKTPVPESTDYRLLDAFCFESRTSLRIIRHGCKPFVMRLSRGRASEDDLSPFLYRIIRDMCKINPRRLMQFNIFDCVSDPKLLVRSPLFTKLSEKGVIEGISSFRDFEIRVFSNSEGYRTFKDFFRLRCSRAGSVIKDNKENIPSGVKPDLALANKLSGQNELFLYQICIFIVPKKEDNAAFQPPKGLVELIEKGGCIRIGLLPIFIADPDSAAPEWAALIEKYRSDDHIYTAT